MAEAGLILASSRLQSFLSRSCRERAEAQINVIRYTQVPRTSMPLGVGHASRHMTLPMTPYFDVGIDPPPSLPLFPAVTLAQELRRASAGVAMGWTQAKARRQICYQVISTCMI